MKRWEGKVAVVTGASSGIGFETVKILRENGMHVVGLARNENRVPKAINSIKGEGRFVFRECDITDEANVEAAFKWIVKEFGDVHILVNSAGCAKQATVADIKTEDMVNIINVNLTGLLHCTRCALKIMKKNIRRESHIVNVNSTYGQRAPEVQGLPFNVYAATKQAVTGLCHSLIGELKRTSIKVSNICPGVVSGTNFYKNASIDGEYIAIQPHMAAEHVAKSIQHILSTPPNVLIAELTIVPVGETI